MLVQKIWLMISFHEKLLLPTLCVAAGIGVAGYFMVWSTPIIQGAGYGYMLAGPITHYYLYDLKSPNEYYFYFNTGLTKVHLYASSFILNFALGTATLYFG